ncbi:hypothetical protein MVEG_00207 [Podila verticillata NRRL 6337]|nr:hypothetical protein MVEG_00207 [Podila verticillata NRRL 6337]
MEAMKINTLPTNVSDNNFGEILFKEHAEFIDRLKNLGKLFTEDDGNDNDRTKNQRGRSSPKRQAKSNSS